MEKTGNGVSHFTPQDVATWLRSERRHVYIGDVLEESDGTAMGVGFARYAPGESNEWFVTYDEVLVVTSGAFSVTSAAGKKTARAGELIYLRRGTNLTYSVEEEGAEVVYVMHPHPTATELYTDHAEMVAAFQPAETAPPRYADGKAEENIALLKAIYDPLESGESYDFQAFFDALADDAVFETPVKTIKGKAALAAYFTIGGELMEFRPFVRPLRYFGAGNQVVQWGFEKFQVKETGVTHEAEWAWIFEFADGKITRIVAIQDLAGISDVVAEATARAQAVADADAA